MIPKATEIRLDPETRSTLEGWVRASSSEQRMVRRAIVLLAADGLASRKIAREVGVMTGVVSIWRNRFAACGIEGLRDKPTKRSDAPAANHSQAPACADRCA
jgi:transposase